MPIVVEIADAHVSAADIESVFAYFIDVEKRFSFFKDDSEVSRMNRGEIRELSPDMQEILFFAEKTKQESHGYFDISRPDGRTNPSGIVKGWAIRNASRLLLAKNIQNFCLNVGGDIQSHGKNENGSEWSIGIRNPLKRNEIVKVIYPRGAGVATSGSSERGSHIYDPHAPKKELNDVVSITVIGLDVLEADRFATAAFAMGNDGIIFIESLPACEGYQIDRNGVATMSTGFPQYLAR